MPDMQSALVARLKSAAPIAGIVGSRIYWTKVPQDTDLPYIRMQTISDERPADLEEYDAARETRVQVDCFAESYQTARALAEAVIYSTAEPATISGVRLGRTKAEGPRDLGEDIAGKFIHQLSIDLLIWHRLA